MAPRRLRRRYPVRHRSERKSEDPGYEFPNEIVLPDLNHGRAGMVNMANGGPHTNSSQWCITLGDRSYLDGDYTVFGQVVEGMDVVMSIVQNDEVRSMRIVRIGKNARAFKPTTESFKVMVEEARARVLKADAAKKAKEDEFVMANWPGAVKSEGGAKFIVLKEGSGPLPLAGSTLKVAYTGTAPLAGKAFVSTAEEGKPYWGETAEEFEIRRRYDSRQSGLGCGDPPNEKGRETPSHRPGRAGL